MLLLLLLAAGAAAMLSLLRSRADMCSAAGELASQLTAWLAEAAVDSLRADSTSCCISESMLLARSGCASAELCMSQPFGDGERGT